MNMQSEVYMLRTGLRNNDFRPGAERDAAQRRLAYLLRLAQNTPSRPRGVIVLKQH